MNIRKKGKWKNGETKFVIEESGKYIETLPPVEDMLKLLRLDSTSCEKIDETREKEETENQKFSQSLLNESSKQDVIEAVRNEQEKIMREVLVK